MSTDKKQRRRHLSGRLIAIAILPLPIALGWWQLQRAEEKRQILDTYQQRVNLPAATVSSELLDGSQMDFRLAIIEGEYDDRYTLFIDNKVHRGQAGYYVVTPIKPVSQDRYLLVNRGWVPLGQSRQKLPVITTPAGTITINGQLRRPAENVFTLEGPSAQSGWNKRWQTLDLSKIEQKLGLSLQPVVMQLAAGDSAGGGFVRDWPEYKDSWVQRHHGYSFQWFSLAILVLIYSLIAGRFHNAGKDY